MPAEKVPVTKRIIIIPAAIVKTSTIKNRKSRNRMDMPVETELLFFDRIGTLSLLTGVLQPL
jgi:hypothetical protein